MISVPPASFPKASSFFKNLKLYIKIGHLRGIIPHTQVFVNDKLTRDSSIEAPYYVTFTAIFSASTSSPASQPKKTIILCVKAAGRPANLPRKRTPELLLFNMNELIAKS